MQFTSLFVPHAMIAARAAQANLHMEALQTGADAADCAAHVIAQRLLHDPERYVEFGPYWWSVKVALRRSGADFGAQDDARVRQAYGAGLTLLETFVAGELFADLYRHRILAGTEGHYLLVDADMEVRRLGRGTRRVATASGGGPADDVHPA